jgi:aspartate racemase
MRERFFRDGLSLYGLEVLVPERDDQDRINDIIYGELCRGVILPQSQAVFLDVIETLRELGAQGVVLGCTEIPLLVRPEDCGLPLYNTTVLHAERALEFAAQPRKRT